MEPRLKTEIWVKALIRRAWSRDVPALLVRRGETTSGAVLIKMGRDQTQMVVYARGMLADGRWGWRRATGPVPVSDETAGAYIERQERFDPDLWVVEIEADDLTAFVDDPLEA